MGDTESFARSYSTAAAAFPLDKVLRLGWYRAVSRPEKWNMAARILADGRTQIGDQIELDVAEAHIATETGDDDRAERLFARLVAVQDSSVAIAHIRHCLRTGRIERAQTLGESWLKTPAAPGFWPYISTIWRLLGDARAEWLDGDPAYIAEIDLPVAADQLSSLAELLRTLHNTEYHPPEQSLRGGTQTQGHLFLRLEPELQAIKAQILDTVQDYVAGLPPFVEGHPLLGTPRTALHFAGAWSVRLSGQGFHVVHTHPLGWISSAFYVALPDRLGEGQAGWLQLGAPPPDLRLDLPPYRMIEPKPGRLALFPSTMWHGTLPFDDGERLTIAFDMRVPSR
jgi:Putative 2OG-Fe(II) oxygenase